MDAATICGLWILGIGALVVVLVCMAAGGE